MKRMSVLRRDLPLISFLKKGKKQLCRLRGFVRFLSVSPHVVQRSSFLSLLKTDCTFMTPPQTFFRLHCSSPCFSEVSLIIRKHDNAYIRSGWMGEGTSGFKQTNSTNLLWCQRKRAYKEVCGEVVCLAEKGLHVGTDENEHVISKPAANLPKSHGRISDMWLEVCFSLAM